MGLDAIIRNGVAIADKITKPLQGTVTRQVWSGQVNGVDQYDTTLEERCLVDRKQRIIRTIDGQETACRALLTYVQPVLVGLHDRITLADGTTGPILDVNGLEDAGDDLHRAFVTEVFLG